MNFLELSRITNRHKISLNGLAILELVISQAKTSEELADELRIKIESIFEELGTLSLAQLIEARPSEKNRQIDLFHPTELGRRVFSEAEENAEFSHLKKL